MLLFFFKQKTAYEMRISDWSSDVCSSDLDHAKPEKKLARDSDPAHKTASQEQAGGHKKQKQESGRKFPGRKPADQVHVPEIRKPPDTHARNARDGNCIRRALKQAREPVSDFP